MENNKIILRKQQELMLITKWRELWKGYAIDSRTTLLDIAKLEAPEISRITYHSGGDKRVCIAILAALILELNLYLGAEWSDDMLEEAASIFYDEYYFASLPEIKHFLYKIKTGTYTIYGKFRPLDLMTFAGTYFGDLATVKSQYLAGKREERPENGDYVGEVRMNAFLSNWRENLEADVAKKRFEEQEERRKIKEEQERKIIAFAKANKIDVDEVKQDLKNRNQKPTD